MMDRVIRCNKSFKLITIAACYDYKSEFCGRLRHGQKYFIFLYFNIFKLSNVYYLPYKNNAMKYLLGALC